MNVSLSKSETYRAADGERQVEVRVGATEVVVDARGGDQQVKIARREGAWRELWEDRFEIAVGAPGREQRLTLDAEGIRGFRVRTGDGDDRIEAHVGPGVDVDVDSGAGEDEVHASGREATIFSDPPRTVAIRRDVAESLGLREPAGERGGVRRALGALGATARSTGEAAGRAIHAAYEDARALVPGVSSPAAAPSAPAVDLSIPAGPRPVPTRIYRSPAGDGSTPLNVHFHGALGARGLRADAGAYHDWVERAGRPGALPGASAYPHGSLGLTGDRLGEYLAGLSGQLEAQGGGPPELAFSFHSRAGARNLVDPALFDYARAHRSPIALLDPVLEPASVESILGLLDAGCPVGMFYGHTRPELQRPAVASLLDALATDPRFAGATFERDDRGRPIGVHDPARSLFIAPLPPPFDRHDLAPAALAELRARMGA